jgi:hypothetical protein
MDALYAGFGKFPAAAHGFASDCEMELLVLNFGAIVSHSSF